MAKVESEKESHASRLENDIRADEANRNYIPFTAITVAVWQRLKGYHDYEKDLRRNCHTAVVLYLNGATDAIKLQRMRLKRRRWARAKARRGHKVAKKARQNARKLSHVKPDAPVPAVEGAPTTSCCGCVVQ
jgi:hypothetical protein